MIIKRWFNFEKQKLSQKNDNNDKKWIKKRTENKNECKMRQNHSSKIYQR